MFQEERLTLSSHRPRELSMIQANKENNCRNIRTLLNYSFTQIQPLKKQKETAAEVAAGRWLISVQQVNRKAQMVSAQTAGSRHPIMTNH